ncbi:MerR family transcriptional regulator [Vagococcus hydrophili]|uniref:MerR family transcriptional regulator n=1 Tax=Vagococcus hydrophili TaxID=2714947 RepID=A0A6G8ART6_9ENTE|nr:MerR family transcriptional regulator [Vagococcus hydrophili]QIL47635.1 MerR family transcriptional regulator [Vagococcus hydrophili]
MRIGQFIEEMKTTKETIRYYIDEKLMTPKKVDGRYEFTEKDKKDFKSIRELREMGLSIRVIKEIKKNKEFCDTKKQWESNLNIIDSELVKIEIELERLSNEKIALINAKKKLKNKL